MKLIRSLLWIWCVMPASVLFAQPAPTIVSTLQTTNTGATSLSVGCAIGSSTCTGGISAGPIAASSAVISGPLGITGGYIEIQSNVPGSQTFRLVNNSGTLQWNGTPLAAGSSVSGTTNTIPLFTAANAVGNSIMTQSGTTITVVNTLSATTLTGTLSTASQPNVTGVGTITTGVWNGTKIGLAYGGTNADLSGTGGTSQFLRQATSGAAITVVRPAIADLSDGTNVAVLNAANTFTGFGTTAFAAGGTGAQALRVRNTTAGTTNFATLQVGTDIGVADFAINSYSSTYTTSGVNIASSSLLTTSTTGGMSLQASDAAGVIRFYTGGTSQRWGINAAGDFTFGASAHIADSSGTPTFTGFGSGATITGTDYAFVIFQGSTNSTGGTVTFGHTFSSQAICEVSSNATPASISATISTEGNPTTQAVIGTANSSNSRLYVQCRSF